MSTNLLKVQSKERAGQQSKHRGILRVILVAVPLGIYISKYAFFAIGHQGTLGIMWLCILPIILIPLILGCCAGLVISIYSAIRRDWIPLLVLFPLMIVGFVLPLLPLPMNATEQHFFNHQAEYETIVESARVRPFSGTESRLAGLFYAEVMKTDPLVVRFNPLNDFYTYVAYAEKIEDLRGVNACDSDGGIMAQLADHWWLCFREWN